MDTYLYGIDFGTTNSALAIYNETTRKIEHTLLIPSLIYFAEHRNADSSPNFVVGEEAIAAYLAEGMKGRFIKSVKQVLSRPSFTETRIQNRRYNAADLVAIILSELKLRADRLTGQDVRKSVIGRPVHFDDDNASKDSLAQIRLSKAASLAGFEDVRFQFEPIGAAFAYERTLDHKERVLVADLGGGTTDFTYLTLDPQKADHHDRKNDMMANGGIYVGGDSLDAAFMWARGTPYFGKHTQYEATPGKRLTVPKSLFARICSWEQMNFFNGPRVRAELEDYYYFSGKDSKFKNLMTLIEHNLGYSVFQSIEQTKISLSSADQAAFVYHKLGIDIDENVQLLEYESIVAKEVQRIADYLDRFIQEQNIAPEDIDSLFLTGGTSQVRSIRKLFQDRFPHASLNTGDHFRSVAAGLAYSGYLFNPA